MAVQKVFFSEQELEPKNRSNVNDGQEICGQKKLHRRKQNQKTSSPAVIYQFHCPVDGCIYDANSERHFSCLKYLQQHYKKVHAVKSFFCEKCGRGFAKPSNCFTHQAVCGTVYECSCGAEYTSREALLTHAKRNTHTLPKNHQTPLKKAFKVKGCDKNLAPPVGGPKVPLPSKPSTVILMLNMAVNGHRTQQTIPVPLDSTAFKRPCLILPKPVPLPPPAVAAIAPSKQAVSESVARNATEIGIQTEVPNRSARAKTCLRCKRLEPSRHVERVHRRTSNKSAGTQTSVLGRRRAGRKAGLMTQSTQTDTGRRRVESELPVGINMSTQTVLESVAGPPMLLPQAYTAQGPLYPFGGPDPWPLADQVMSPAPFALVARDKFCQTLGVDVRFSMSPAVSSSTQTSPRVVDVPKPLLCADALFHTSLQRYLGVGSLPTMQDYHMAHPSRGTPQHLSSETQTDFDLSLLLDDADSDDGGVPSSNIQTQTSSEDLEAIPYDQLLSHMETQTTDPYLLTELGNFCDIQTQTMYAHANPSLVDTTTQTCLNPSERPIHMETQTLLSLLDGAGDCAFSDSHTQTSDMMSLFDYYAAASDSSA